MKKDKTNKITREEKQNREEKPIDLTGIKDNKSDFLRHFLFYLSIVLVLFAFAFILSILPNILSESSKSNQIQNTSLSNLQNLGNLDALQQIQSYEQSNRVCNTSMTDNSKLYNVKYNIKYKLNTYGSYSNESNDSTTDGYIMFKTIKNESGYSREIVYYINFSKLIAQLNTGQVQINRSQSNLSDYYQKIFESISEIKMNYFYDSNFVCKNGNYSLSLNGKEYTESLDCIPADIPFQICKEDLKEIKSYTLNLSSGSYNVKEYLLKRTETNSIQSLSNPYLDSSASSQDIYLTFSDLPFPITLDSTDMYMELVNYSEISK